MVHDPNENKDLVQKLVKMVQDNKQHKQPEKEPLTEEKRHNTQVPVDHDHEENRPKQAPKPPKPKDDDK
jgi:hypothetical protein